MSDSLSPSGSDLIMDDGDLNNMSAEAKCGLIPGGEEKETRGRITFVSKLSTPVSQTAFKFGSPVRGLVSNNPVGSKISVADPRTKYKPSGFLSLEKSNDVAPIKEKTNRDRKVDHLNIKRTVQNSFGTSSFGEGQTAVSSHKPFSFGSPSPAQVPSIFKFGSPSVSPPQECRTSPALPEEVEQEELRKFMQMKTNQEVKMRAEKEKMQKIDQMIEIKKREKQMTELKQEKGRIWIARHGSSAEDIGTRKEM